MSGEIKGILNKFDKVLENYELEKKIKQFSVDSICHLFPNEMMTIKNTITSLQQKVEQLENIRKEAVEYIGMNIPARALEQLYTNYELGVSLLFVKTAEDLLNILNKGDNNVKDKR